MSLTIKPHDYDKILAAAAPPGELRYTVFIHVLNDGSHQARIVVETNELIRAYSDAHTALCDVLARNAEYVGYVRIWDNGRGCLHEQCLFYERGGKRVIHKVKEVKE